MAPDAWNANRALEEARRRRKRIVHAVEIEVGCFLRFENWHACCDSHAGFKASTKNDQHCKLKCVFACQVRAKVEA